MARMYASLVAFLLVFSTVHAQAVQAQDDAESATPAAPSSGDELSSRQDKIAKEYQRLEEVMLKMADFETANNPALAKLLRQAVAQSKSRFTARELGEIVELLATHRLQPALDSQSAVKTDLQQLLELLLTASRPERLKSEQARVREYIEEINRLQRLEQGIRGRTEGGADPAELSKEQLKTADRAAKLAQRIAENEESGKEGKQTDGDGEPKEGDSPGEQEPKQGDENPAEKPSETPDETPEGTESPAEKPGETPGEEPRGKPGEQPSEKPAGEPSEQPPGEMPPGDMPPGKQGEQQPSQGQPGGESQQNQDSQQGGENQQGEEQPQDEYPAKKRIREAEEKMREAERKLAEAKRDEAVLAQREAERKLQEAKAELEEILRQMREEEVERMLAMLEGRFRKMLEQELKLYENTKRLDKIADKRNREFEPQAGRLAHEQRSIRDDAEKSLQLLLEEGSSIAFPETVELMVEDMEQVAHRLDRSQVDSLTQGVEEEIIQALEEMIEALQQAQQDLEEQKQQQQQQQNQQGGEQEDQPLVDQIAELRMIRALQMRVNLRTQRYARLLADAADPIGQAPGAELRDALLKLAEREERVRRITRDIVLGKNK